MRKRMKRYLSLCLSLCMLVMATPPIGLAEDGTATVAAAEQAAVLEPQAAADAADVTPAAAAAPDPAATPETTPDPDAASEPYVVLQAEPDATAVPEAEAEPDATAVPDADAAPEDDATRDPDATPEPEGSAVPSEEPTLVDSEPTPVGIEELPPLEEEASDEPAMLEAADITITNTHGVLSYTVPEGVTVTGQQWLLNGNPISGASGATYKLTMADMKNKTNVLSVRLTLSDGNPVTSGGYSMSANDQWVLEDDSLSFNKNYAQNTTGFPLNNNEIISNDFHVNVNPDVSVSGVTLTCDDLQNYGTITDSTLEIKHFLINPGTIYGCEFPYSGGAQVIDAGTLYVPVTINGRDCSSKPGDSLRFLYGKNTLEALKEWYEANCGTYDELYVHFLCNDGKNTRVNRDMQLGLSNSFSMPYCTIEAPDGLLPGSTVRASVQQAAYGDLSYSWHVDGSELGRGDTVTLPDIEPGATAEVTLYVYVGMMHDGDFNYLELSASATFSGVAYDVAVDYENDNLVITPLGDVTIDGAFAQAGKYQSAGAPVGGICTLPLSFIEEDRFDAELYVYNNDSGQLAGPTSLSLSRVTNTVSAEELSFSLADTANADGSRDATILWNSDAPLDIRVGISGEVYKGLRSGAVVPVPAGKAVTLYARTPGSAAEKLLPSWWVEFGSIDASDWLYLNVSSTHDVSDSDTLFWGETLKIKASPNATLTWKINGEDVAAPVLNSNTYGIPAGVSSLSITATNDSGSVTRALSGIESPLDYWLDYEKEAIVLQRKEGCKAFIKAVFGLGSVNLTENDEYIVYLSNFNLPTNEAGEVKFSLHILSLNSVSTDMSVTIPARFAGSASYGSVGYDFLSLDPELQDSWRYTVTTTDSEGVRYADVKFVDSSGAETPCSYDSPTGKWYPEGDNGLRGDRDYSIYAKQYSVDAEGKQNSFASDWFDTGVRFAPCTLGLSNTEPLVGDTVTATIPDNVRLGEIEGLYYKWYYVDDSGARAEITGVTGDSLTIQPDSGYENCRLRVEAWFANNRALGYAETAVIPAPEIIVKCDGEELEKAANGNYIAYLGDTITVEVENVSQTFLNGAEDVSWLWDIGGSTIDSPSLELEKDRFGDITFCDVKVALGKGTTVIQLFRGVYIYVAPAPDVTIDYENETLVVMKPENPLPEGYLLYVDVSDGTNIFTSDVVDKENTVPIASVKSDWPDHFSRAVVVFWADGTKPSSISALVTIPARPAVQQPTIYPSAFAISVEDVSLADYEMKLVARGGAVTDESIGSLVEDADKGNVRITGLESLKEYTLWMRKKATDSAFRSAWTSFDAFTSAAIELAPSLTWTTGYDPKGFSLSAEDVLNHVSFTRTSTGKKVIIPIGYLTLTRADGESFPITDAGTYNLKLTLVGAITDDYCLSTDTLTLTVQPYEVSSFDFDSRVTYKGAAYDPYDFKVRVGERVLTKDDYTIAVDDGAELRDAGEYTAHIAFKGNYTSSLDGEVHPLIAPCTLRATAFPEYASRVYDGSTAVECAADWRSPFEGDEVVVKTVGAMKNKDAGSGKSVAITLWLEGAQSGNYVLNSTSQTGSVDIEKKEIALRPEQPADFAYTGDTAVPLSKEGWTLEGVLTGDDVYVDASGASATVEDPNAGANKAVSFTGWQLAGADKDNYVVGSVEARSVSITKAQAPKINWPTAGDIRYGQSLADSVLSHSRDENGSFAWQQPEYVPTQADEWGFTMIYTPDDTANYAYEEVKLRRAITIRVNSAAAPAIQWPSASAIRFGQSLADSVLASNDANGSFAWVNPDERPNAGQHSFAVRYTPDDVKNYDYSGVTLERDVAVTVLPADAPAILWPSASAITYGDSLRASVLTSADANGSFAWKNPDEQPNAGTAYCVVVYTPDNASDYDYGAGAVTVEQAIPVTVHKAQSAIDVSGVVVEYSYTGKMQIVDSGATLNHSECALIYSNNSFTTVAEGDGLTVKISAAETANYLAAEAEVTIHVAKAEAPKIILPAASRLTYGQRLSESALTGSESAPGSFAWENGDVLLPAGLNSCNVVFIPDDPDNYAWTQEMLVQKIEVIVDQKPVRLTVENASKTYGDADPKAKVSVAGVLKGDSLSYSVSRRSGEDVGTYAYSVELGSNPNYMPDVLLGTLTIEPRSIADGSVSISAVGRQTYTGREIKPAPKLCFGGARLVLGTDYELSYSNNVRTGRATITITGKGNFSGSCDLSFRIVEAPEETSAKAQTAAPVRDEALQNYLNDMFSLVFDAEYAPVDFVQIPVLVSGEDQEGVLLICASQEGGEPAQRSMILNAAQLVRLQRTLQEYEIGDLIFENGSAAARMNLEALTGGNLAKLMALILSGEEIADESLQSDWSAMEDAKLSEAAYARFDLEVRIAPVVQEDGEPGFEISVWLRYDGLELNVSDLIDGLNVVLDVRHLVTAENADAVEGLYAIARRSGEETELLDSVLMLAPTVSVDDSTEATPTISGHYALTAPYAGEGTYWVAETELQ